MFGLINFRRLNKRSAGALLKGNEEISDALQQFWVLDFATASLQTKYLHPLLLN